jgi:hypothetical protein
MNPNSAVTLVPTSSMPAAQPGIPSRPTIPLAGSAGRQPASVTRRNGPRCAGQAASYRWAATERTQDGRWTLTGAVRDQLSDSGTTSHIKGPIYDPCSHGLTRTGTPCPDGIQAAPPRPTTSKVSIAACP